MEHLPAVEGPLGPAVYDSKLAARAACKSCWWQDPESLPDREELQACGTACWQQADSLCALDPQPRGLQKGPSRSLGNFEMKENTDKLCWQLSSLYELKETSHPQYSPCPLAEAFIRQWQLEA